MKTFHEEIPDLCQDALTDQLFDEHSIFFDIETTGFSPANSTLYMIGCARRKSNRICIDQFFAEKPEEEAEILAAFFQMLSTLNLSKARSLNISIDLCVAVSTLLFPAPVNLI